MKVSAYIPNERLRPYIKEYRIIESAEKTINRVIPNISFAMAFRLHGNISYIAPSGDTYLPKATFSGLRRSVRLIHYTRQASTLIVLFREMGVSAFFREPMHELFEASAPLDNFIKRSVLTEIEERLSASDNNITKIAIIERFLISLLRHTETDKLIAEALTLIDASKGMTRIKKVAETLYISPDAFEKRFRKVVGATPKQFAAIVQMNAVIRQHTLPSSLTDLAIEHGYYDQPHFNKAFKQFTGQTPKEFFNASSYW